MARNLFVRSMLSAISDSNACVISAAAIECSSSISRNSIKINNLFYGKLSYIGASPRFNADESFGFKSIQSFPNGRLANAKLICQMFLSQPRTFNECPGKQLFFDTAVGEFRQIRDVCQFFICEANCKDKIESRSLASAICQGEKVCFLSDLVYITYHTYEERTSTRW